jgi:hypothetical protein
MKSDAEMSRDPRLNDWSSGSSKQFHRGIQIDGLHNGTAGELRNYQPQVDYGLGDLPEGGIQRYSLLLSDECRAHLLAELLMIG